MKVNLVAYFRGFLAEIFIQTQCFLVQHIAVNCNTFSVQVYDPQI